MESNGAAIDWRQFLETLERSRLLYAFQIRAVLDRWSPAAVDGDPAVALAMEFVQTRALTPYQAKVIYNGLPHPLVFGEFLVVDKIGQGGMGQVYRVRHRDEPLEGALKRISAAAIAKSPTAVERFQREIEFVTRLSHPNVVRAIAAGQEDGSYFLVTEFIDGIDFKRRVKKDGPLSPVEAVDCVVQAARGLAHAHRRGIIHRDVKPDNLLSDPYGVVKVLDFGLARREDEPDAPTPTVSATTGEANGATGSAANGSTNGAAFGTVEYIAPEQLLDARQVDQRADVYSLGCTLHYLLTGRALYGGESSKDKMAAHWKQPIPNLEATRDDLPAGLRAAFERMVAKRPADRQATMDEVIAQLSALGLPISEAVPEPPTSDGERVGGGTWFDRAAESAREIGQALRRAGARWRDAHG